MLYVGIESRLSIISGGNISYRGLFRKITGVGGGTRVLPMSICGGIGGWSYMSGVIDAIFNY